MGPGTSERRGGNCPPCSPRYCPIEQLPFVCVHLLVWAMTFSQLCTCDCRRTLRIPAFVGTPSMAPEGGEQFGCASGLAAGDTSRWEEASPGTTNDSKPLLYGAISGAIKPAQSSQEAADDSSLQTQRSREKGEKQLAELRHETTRQRSSSLMTKMQSSVWKGK